MKTLGIDDSVLIPIDHQVGTNTWTSTTPLPLLQRKEAMMTKKLQEIALSFFLTACGLSILMGILWMRPVIESQRLLIDETRRNQDVIMKAAEETRAIVTEIGYAAAVIAMMENRMIQPADANKMIDESVITLEAGCIPRLSGRGRMGPSTEA